MMNEGVLPLTVVVLAKNEAANLPRCLAALEFVSEIIVVDDNSEDETREVAERYGARVERHAFSSFADQRNWAMDHANVSNEWVLHLDADEVVTPELAGEIRDAVTGASAETAGFLLCFKTMFQDQWLRFSSTFPVWILRLVRLDRVRYVPKGHGEGFEADGQLGRVSAPFLHYNFSKGLTEWFAKHNRYSSREAEAILESGSEIDLRGLLSRDAPRRRRALKRFSWRLPLRPWIKFCYMYFLRGGILDRRAGLTYCVMQAIYEYTICLKVRERRRSGQHRQDSQSVGLRAEVATAKGEHT